MALAPFWPGIAASAPFWPDVACTGLGWFYKIYGSKRSWCSSQFRPNSDPVTWTSSAQFHHNSMGCKRRRNSIANTLELHLSCTNPSNSDPLWHLHSPLMALAPWVQFHSNSASTHYGTVQGIKTLIHKCNTRVSPVIKYWRYHSLALSHPYTLPIWPTHPPIAMCGWSQEYNMNTCQGNTWEFNRVARSTK